MANFKKVKVTDLADYVIAKLNGVSHLKLHKLIYYIEAWHLAVLDSSVIDEEFEAWLHGPAIRSLFGHFRGRGFFIYDTIQLDTKKAAEVISSMESQLSKEQIELLSDVLAEYGDKSAYHLECLTHSESPWIEARKGVPDGEASQNIISKKTIKKFYESQLS